MDFYKKNLILTLKLYMIIIVKLMHAHTIIHIKVKMRRKLTLKKNYLSTNGQQGVRSSKNKILHLQHEHKTWFEFAKM
jgi:hypothetical protein